MADGIQEQLTSSLSKALASGAYSDLTITCGDDSYTVHKVVVCERAGFFARALKFGGQETKDSKIDLPEDEPDMVKLLIGYLYTGEYEPRLSPDEGNDILANNLKRYGLSPKNTNGSTYSYKFPHTCSAKDRGCEEPYVCPHHYCYNTDYSYSNDTKTCSYGCKSFTCEKCYRVTLPEVNGNSEQMLLHAKMYELADKYDVIGLKVLAKEKFERACGHFWNASCFGTAAHHAFSTTPEADQGLRRIISTTISKHMELIEKPEVKVLLTEFNGLALGILEEKIIENGWGKKNAYKR
ncbi:hypothetical protein ACN47E_009471 [Coniothyrium glycines]